MRPFADGVVVLLALALSASPASAQTGRTREAWLALAKSGFALPDGTAAIDVLIDANPLLASPDPVLRDDVAFSAAERWIVRDGWVAPDDLRRLLTLWTSNLQDGLESPGDDRVFKRSFSALCLSLIAARDLAAPFLSADEVAAFFDRVLDYFERERDLRGFDPVRGWMHTPAHTSDTLKFLARNPKLPGGSDRRLLAAVQRKIESSNTVFVWGENGRMALALQSSLRRPDAVAAAVEEWGAHWIDEYKTLWAKGPHVDPARFARVENARQVMASLHAALSMETNPTSNGDTARKVILAALAKMR
jgi:uncharacterized protein DUF2785